MALSVRLDPLLELQLEQESRRLGITKSAFVKEALERILGVGKQPDRQELSDHLKKAIPREDMA